MSLYGVLYTLFLVRDFAMSEVCYPKFTLHLSTDFSVNDHGVCHVITNVYADDDTDFEIPNYSLNITNLKQIYSKSETARFNLFARNRDWSPTIYTVATEPAEGISIEDAYYKVFRISDNLEVIPFGTGSMNHTRLSFDGKANYFNLDMALLESGYSYGIRFTFSNSGKNYEQKETFKFRVED